jgi:hypothetical protein
MRAAMRQQYARLQKRERAARCKQWAFGLLNVLIVCALVAAWFYAATNYVHIPA